MVLWDSHADCREREAAKQRVVISEWRSASGDKGRGVLGPQGELETSSVYAAGACAWISRSGWRCASSVAVRLVRRPVTRRGRRGHLRVERAGSRERLLPKTRRISRTITTEDKPGSSQTNALTRWSVDVGAFAKDSRTILYKAPQRRSPTKWDNKNPREWSHNRLKG